MHTIHARVNRRAGTVNLHYNPAGQLQPSTWESTMTPEQRILRSRLAAHTKWAQTEDRVAATEPARRGFLDRFERQVDPDGVLDPRERAIRAEHARKAHFLRMAMRSAEVRAAKRGRRK